MFRILYIIISDGFKFMQNVVYFVFVANGTKYLFCIYIVENRIGLLLEKFAFY